MNETLYLKPDTTSRSELVLKPQLPPYALLHYRDFDSICAYLGGVCERLEEAYGGAFYIAYTRPQLIRRAIQGAEFEGPYAQLWRRLQLDRLPASFERWPREGGRRCPGLIWRASPSVFLMSPERMYRHVVRSTTLVRLLRELGLLPLLWRYDERKRVVLRPVERPWELMHAVAERLPPAEELGACGHHAAASMKYWAETGRVHSVESILEKWP